MRYSFAFLLLTVITFISAIGKGNTFEIQTSMRDRVHIPADLNGCIAELDKIIPDSEKVHITAMTELEFSAKSHFGIGLWIRNNWDLWKGSRLTKYFHSKGIYHPDDVSGIILTSYHRHLNKEDIRLDEQIRHYQAYWEKARTAGTAREMERFSLYHVSDTVVFRYRYGFASEEQEDDHNEEICTAKGIITELNKDKLSIKVKLLDGCGRKGILTEKPKLLTRKHMKAGEENWFKYSDWGIKK